MNHSWLFRSLPVLALGVAGFGTTEATAQSASPQPRSSASTADGDPRPRELPAARTWYGDQTIVVDVASTLTMLGGLAGHADGVFVVGLAGYALGGPAVHAAHGRPEIMLASFLMRLALPTVAALAGAAIAGATIPERPSINQAFFSPQVEGGIVGLALGMFGAMVLDSAVLAWKPAQRDRAARLVTLLPRVAIDRDRDNALHGAVGLEGTF